MQTITRIRSAGFDGNGDPIAGGDVLDIPGCMVAPGQGVGTRPSTDVESRGREAVNEGVTVYAPFGADIVHTDTILLPGDDQPWKVDGEVGRWENGFTGWRPGLTVVLKRAAG